MGRKPPEYRTAALGDAGGSGDVGSILFPFPPPYLFHLFSLSLLSAPYQRVVSVEQNMFFDIMITSPEPNRQLLSLYPDRPDLMFDELASLTLIVRVKN